MGIYIGLDIGTTTITGLVIDTESQRLLAQQTVPNDAEVTSATDRQQGRSEWDIERMGQLAVEILGNLGEQCDSAAVAGVGVTGQQHGMVLLDPDGKPCSLFIGWRDRRCRERLPSGQTYRERMLELGADEFARSGCLPASGYMGSTLFWLAQNDLLPDNTQACFAPDYVASLLAKEDAVTDPTDAASSGIYDIYADCWNEKLLTALGIAPEQLPPVRPSCEKLGGMTPRAAQLTGLPTGLPVTVGCGDNQASFAGSVAHCADSLLINVGTGGQIAVFVAEPLAGEGLELRPYLQGGYLLVGAGLCGGRSYQTLADFIRQVGVQICDCSQIPDLYEKLNQLAAEVPPGAEGLRCEPLFTGSRHEPDRRAVWRGMSEENFTLGHMARALLEGIADQFRIFYQEMSNKGVAERRFLVGSGNGIRKNPLLREIMSDCFGAPMAVASHNESAAVGAGLCAAVAVGEFASIQEASQQFIRYQDDR